MDGSYASYSVDGPGVVVGLCGILHVRAEQHEVREYDRKETQLTHCLDLTWIYSIRDAQRPLWTAANPHVLGAKTFKASQILRFLKCTHATRKDYLTKLASITLAV